MRTAGTVLTILALVLVQAPWIVCACDGNGSVTSLLAGVIAHGADDHHGHGDHAHGCCDGVAHAVHGAGHAHGLHCHGTYGHTHDDESPDAPTERHEGFRLALRTLPGAVQLHDAAPAPAALHALASAVGGAVHAPEAEVVGIGPPGRPTLPAACTERLLL